MLIGMLKVLLIKVYAVIVVEQVVDANVGKIVGHVLVNMLL